MPSSVSAVGSGRTRRDETSHVIVPGLGNGSRTMEIVISDSPNAPKPTYAGAPGRAVTITGAEAVAVPRAVISNIGEAPGRASMKKSIALAPAGGTTSDPAIGAGTASAWYTPGATLSWPGRKPIGPIGVGSGMPPGVP